MPPNRFINPKHGLRPPHPPPAIVGAPGRVAQGPKIIIKGGRIGEDAATVGLLPKPATGGLERLGIDRTAIDVVEIEHHQVVAVGITLLAHRLQVDVAGHRQPIAADRMRLVQPIGVDQPDIVAAACEILEPGARIIGRIILDDDHFERVIGRSERLDVREHAIEEWRARSGTTHEDGFGHG